MPNINNRSDLEKARRRDDLLLKIIMTVGIVAVGFCAAMVFYSSCHAQDTSKWLPDKHRTPGVSAGHSSADATKLCDPKFFTVSVRHVTQGEKCGVFHTYGIQCDQCDKNAKLKCGSFEIDHLISLELGGTNDPANLWPEPYNGVCGAHVKDGLETHLAAEVCKGRVTLADAQKAISTNWIKAYRQYVDATLSCK